MKMLIVDDHMLFAEGVQLVLGLQDIDCDVCATAEEALARVSGNPYDLVLVDLNMPVVDGLALIRQIRGAKPDQDLVMISAQQDLQKITKGIDAGARGFIPKTYRTDDLLAALERIKNGDLYLPDDIRSKLARRQEYLPEPDITQRQAQVLNRMAAGKTNRQIAEELHITQYTVKYHVTALLERFGAANRTECVQAATQAGYLTTSGEEV